MDQSLYEAQQPTWTTQPTTERLHPIPEGVDTSALTLKKGMLTMLLNWREQKVQDPRFYAEQYCSPVGVLTLLQIYQHPGVEIPKMPEFQYKEYEAARNIASVVVPTSGGTGALGLQVLLIHVLVGVLVKQTMQWIGNRGVESLAGLGVGVAVSTKVITLPVLKSLSLKPWFFLTV